MTWQSFIPLIWCLYVVRSQYEPHGENVAYRKPTNQSTTYEEYNASLGVDGGISTNFIDGTCSHTGEWQNYSWWTVDLAGFYWIKFIRIYQWTLIECVPFSIENGSIEVVKYGDSNQTFTFGTKFNVICHEGYRMLDNGVPAQETESVLECNATGNWSRNLTCSVTVCGRPPNIPNNSKEIITAGISGNNTYNATMTVECNEGYNYSLHEREPLRCASDGLWTGNLGNCNVIDCGQPIKIPGESTIVFSTGLAGNTSYNATFTIHCNKGFRYTHPGNETIRCGNQGHWTGSLGLCKVIDCGQPLNIPGNSTIEFSTGLAGITSYSATFTIHCNIGFHYTLPGNETVRCGHEGHWTGNIGICEVTRCTEIVPPEYGVIVVEPGTEGRWSFNTTVVIICNTGYSLNGETLIKCLETGRWTNALGYCLALPEKNADEEECKTSVLGWVITGPFCIILLVTNIATCLRFRRHTNSDMQTINNKSNELENNAMEPYDNLQMENRAKSEYDQLAFERESSLKTAMKNEI